MAKPALDIEKLTKDERLEPLEEVWDSLSRDPAGLPLTAEQEADLDRRLDSLDQDGAVGTASEDLHGRLRKQ